jgi:ribose transport system ATP-binding protein
VPSEVLLRAEGVSKRYPGTQALADVGLEIRAGEVHCLLGENGAGKSTLVKILAGAVAPDAGTIAVRGEPVRFESPAHAQRHGISVIYQELDLLPDLTVAQNLFLGHEPRRLGVIRGRERSRRARAILDQLGCGFSAEARVGRLSLAEQQMTALARALTVEASLIVMDEPSAALNEHELERLLAVIRDLVAHGRSVVYVSHRLPEIQAIGDRATVLRDGRHVATVALADVDEPELVRHMIGSAQPIAEGAGTANRPAPAAAGPPLLRIRRAHRPGVLDVGDLEVKPGEVVGLTGLVGSGRTSLLAALFGDGGRDLQLDAELDGRPYAPRRPADAIARGVALVPEDRKRSGLVLDLSVAANAALPSYGRLARAGLLRPRDVRAHAERLVEQLGVRCTGPAQRVRLLSGGNQQKVVLGKWLGRGVRLLLLDEPTRGLDLGAKAAVWAELTRLAAGGLTTLVASSELGELLEHCDRVLVLHEGRLVAERRASAAHRDEILTAAITGEMP